MTYQEKLKLCAEHGKDPVGDWIHDNRADIDTLLTSEYLKVHLLSDMKEGAQEYIFNALHEIENYTDTENSNAVEKEKDDSGRVRDMNHG